MRKSSIRRSFRQVFLACFIAACSYTQAFAQVERVLNEEILEQLLQSHPVPVDLIQPGQNPLQDWQQSIPGRRVSTIDLRTLLDGHDAGDIGVIFFRDKELYMTHMDESGNIRAFLVHPEVCKYIPWICKEME